MGLPVDDVGGDCFETRRASLRPSFSYRPGMGKQGLRGLSSRRYSMNYAKSEGYSTFSSLSSPSSGHLNFKFDTSL
jgi:hypothetical protein